MSDNPKTIDVHDMGVAGIYIMEGVVKERDVTIAALRALNAEAMEAAGELYSRIEQWSKAYPTSAFPEPDMVQARDALWNAGITLDCVSASNMRHVIKVLMKHAEPLAALLQRTTSEGTDER